MITETTSALFDYRLHTSARARGVRLRVSMEHGLEVVVPLGFDALRIPSLLRSKEQWIRAALARAEQQRALFGYSDRWVIPDQIKFPAFGRTWSVAARTSMASAVQLRETAAGVLTLVGRIDDEAACRAALTRWLMRQAGECLAPRLQRLSERTGLTHRGISIRRQRSRWGSCSRHGAINLNAKLVFLSPALMEYVLIHELCHLREMNHSARFWSLVRQHDPDFRANDRALRDGWKSVPPWAR